MKDVSVLGLCIIVIAVLSLFLVGCTAAPSTTDQLPTTPSAPANNVPSTETAANATNPVTSITDYLNTGYYGKILAGNKTPYIEFNAKDYEKATSEGKIILLYFYTDLNSISMAEEEKLFKAFNDMSNSKMIGFKVHYKDAETSDAETQLAETLQVKNAHTKVILKNGKVMQIRSETWDINSYAAQMSLYLEN